VVSTAAGCGAMIESYGHLLADEPGYADAARVAAAARDISEAVASALDATTKPQGRPQARGTVGGGALRVAYDPPCHLLHAQRVAHPPVAVLRATPGVELVELEDADQCCGAAGIYNLLQPAVSHAVLAPKLAHIAASGADWVATGNPGCLMQIGAGLRRTGSRTRVVHPIELLDSAYS
jgi:glycolate oxidase iron-sulfur subunit